MHHVVKCAVFKVGQKANLTPNQLWTHGLINTFFILCVNLGCEGSDIQINPVLFGKHDRDDMWQ